MTVRGGWASQPRLLRIIHCCNRYWYQVVHPQVALEPDSKQTLRHVASRRRFSSGTTMGTTFSSGAEKALYVVAWLAATMIGAATRPAAQPKRAWDQAVGGGYHKDTMRNCLTLEQLPFPRVVPVVLEVSSCPDVGVVSEKLVLAALRRCVVHVRSLGEIVPIRNFPLPILVAGGRRDAVDVRLRHRLHP